MERSSNFELLRIFCMLMIVGGHIIGIHDTPFSLDNPDEIIKLLFYGGFLVAANAFVIISGYFGIKFKKERLIRLVLQVIFYSVALLIFAIAIGWHTFLPKKDFMLFFPILFKQYWFITCYVMLYIISPLLNKWAGSLNKNDYKKLLSAGFLIIYVWPTLSFLVNAPQFINDAGYGIVNFSYLYMLGYYIRHYYSRQFVSNRLIYWGGYFSLLIALFLFQSGLSWILGFEFTSWFSYNTVFIFIGAVCFFMAFKNIKIQSSFINKLAKPCLAVYLIHKHPLIWGNFCSLIDVNSYHGLNFIFLFFTLPIAIYLFCVVIENCRLCLMHPIEIWITNRLLPLTD